MKKILTIVTVFILMIGLAKSQESKSSLGTPSAYYTGSWMTTFTLGDFHDWVDVATPAGFDFGGRYFITDQIAVGFNCGWSRVGQSYDYQTVNIPDKGIAITATNYRSTWIVPLMIAADYHWLSDGIVSPFIGLGIGTDYMQHHLMIQEYDIYQDRWDFSLAPEVGALIRFGNYSNWGATITYNYKWTTNRIENDLLGKESKQLQMMNLKVGISVLID